MLENTVPIHELAIFVRKMPVFTSCYIHGISKIETIFQFSTICAYILYG